MATLPTHPPAPDTVLAGPQPSGRQPSLWNFRVDALDMYEYIFCLEQHDSAGLTEKVTLAWLTREARTSRKAFAPCWGVYGLFARTAPTNQGFWGDVWFEVGLGFMALGLVGALWPRPWWSLLALSFFGGALLAGWAYPRVEEWDNTDLAPQPGQRWEEIIEEYYAAWRDEIQTPTCHPCADTRHGAMPYDEFEDSFEGASYRYFGEEERNYDREVIDAHPELIPLKRVQAYGRVGGCLSPSPLPRQPLPEVLTGWADWCDWLRYSLMIDSSRSFFGQSEFFFSFSFLAPSSVGLRGLDPRAFGPRRLFWWPFLYPGTFFREVVYRAGCTLVCLSLVPGYYYLAGLAGGWFGFLAFSLLSGGLGLLGRVLPTLETWGLDFMLGTLPGGRPFPTRGLRWKQRWWLTGCARCHSKPNSFVTWLLICPTVWRKATITVTTPTGVPLPTMVGKPSLPPRQAVKAKCTPMRHTSFTEAIGLVVTWVLLSFLILDEEPVFDFSDWNLTHISLLAIGFFTIVWENLLRARSGAYAWKDLVLGYATLFFIYSLERYAQLIQIVFFCHCLAPLEIDLMDSTEVFLEYFLPVTAYLGTSLLWLGALSMGAYLGSFGFFYGRPHLDYLGALLVALGLALGWLVIGWDLSINSLSLLDVGAGADLLYAHSPSSLTYNAISNNGDQFDWHKEQVRPFMVRFEVFYLFAMQLLLFVSLGFSAWLWGFIAIDLYAGASCPLTLWGIGLRNLAHVAATNVLGFSLVGLPYLRALLHTPLEVAPLV